MIDCSFVHKHNLGLYGERRVITKTKEDGKTVIVKREKIFNKSPDEYYFYKKYSEKIKDDKMDRFLSIPIRVLSCEKSKIYVLNYFENDYTDRIIRKTDWKTFLDYSIQLCLQVYYLNHYLHMFHNDLIKHGKIWNVMLEDNNKFVSMKVDNFKHETSKNIVRVIDFGRPRKKPDFVLKDYYKVKGGDYPFRSEVFLVLFLTYRVQKDEDISFRLFYDSFYLGAESHKEFDKYILSRLFDAYYSNLTDIF